MFFHRVASVEAVLFRFIANIGQNRIDAATHEAVAETYRPIIRGYFGVAFGYYLIMTFTHLSMLEGWPRFYMSGVSILATLIIGSAWYLVRKPRPIAWLEILTSSANFLVLANVTIALQIDFAEPKLIYFVMMVMIFAFACVSVRQALFSIMAALAVLFYELTKNSTDNFSLYAFVAFGAALSALSIVVFLRRAIGLAVANTKAAEIRLTQAEDQGEEMRQQSLSDSLTELPNRRAFFEIFNGQKSSPQSQNCAWLVLLDLDGFKVVNDVYGHLIGDELLKEVANRMSHYCGQKAHISRMGGDEFNIVLDCNHNPSEVEEWCQGLLEKIAETYQIEERLIQISGSIGCIQFNAEKTGSETIRYADYALLHAKKHGKNRVEIFCEDHAKGEAERFAIEQALRVAKFDDELQLKFQPQCNLSDSKMVRAEALARWVSPNLGNVNPDRFIQIAEESGLIANITLSVMRKAIEAIKSWPVPIPISINLSGHDLISDQTIDEIIALSKSSGLAPHLIEFEVTETAMMADMEAASANMQRLSSLGHPMALDDFGTGYSNFTYLRSLPIDKLKVDRSFMENMTDPMTEKILHSLVGMSRTLGVACLLEGVETELERMMAKRVGAQFVQGYLFAKPMEGRDLCAFLIEQRQGENSAEIQSEFQVEDQSDQKKKPKVGGQNKG